MVNLCTGSKYYLTGECEVNEPTKGEYVSLKVTL